MVTNLMNRFTARFYRAIFAFLLVASCLSIHAQASRWTNSLGQVFVPVPSTHVSFSIWETRVKDFAAFAATQPKLDGTNWNRSFYHAITPVSPGPDFPVVNVSWNDAQAFCQWLTAAEHRSGLLP